VSLSCLIGTRGIRDSFHLDVYSQVAEGKFKPARKHRTTRKNGGRGLLSIKSELASFAHLAAKKVQIRKLHNKLTNQFRKTVFANFRPQESTFDLLVDDWKKGRKLLIEAKTAWTGTGGRMQVRQAIGQLFDYRMTHFPDVQDQVDLAILLPTEPSEDIKELLGSLDIEVLWFKGRKLQGTVSL